MSFVATAVISMAVAAGVSTYSAVSSSRAAGKAENERKKQEKRLELDKLNTQKRAQMEQMTLSGVQKKRAASGLSATMLSGSLSPDVKGKTLLGQ